VGRVFCSAPRNIRSTASQLHPQIILLTALRLFRLFCLRLVPPIVVRRPANHALRGFSFRFPLIGEPTEVPGVLDWFFFPTGFSGQRQLSASPCHVLCLPSLRFAKVAARAAPRLCSLVFWISLFSVFLLGYEVVRDEGVLIAV